MKTLNFQPINERQEIHTGSSILDGLLAKRLNVRTACGGKGRCATCHVFVRQGAEQLTPRTEREERTLSFIGSAKANSRLACQCRVMGEGVIVDLPEGMYIERVDELLQLLGKRAEANILHPIHGAILIAAGKIITRSRLEELKRLDTELSQIQGS